MSEKKLIAGRYQMGDLLGHGGMGDVFRGVDHVTSREVAIKRLHPHIVRDNPHIVDRFVREGEALRQLGHPNIVDILDIVDEGHDHYLVMEYVSGGSLRDLVDEVGRVPVKRVLEIALDLADALTRAHRLHIIHRDIKPANVLLAEDGTPRLTDFGVAHLGDRTRLTETGSVIGTYAYLSPEACNGLPLDERADIWAFGVMLYEMLAGRLPFDESSTGAILTAILTKPAPDLQRLRADIPQPLLNLIYSMLEKDREHRIASVRLVGAELESIIRHLDTPARTEVLGEGEPGSGEPGSRFATPSDKARRASSSDVPAMERSTPGLSHGLSVYPVDEVSVKSASGPQPTPTTGEVILDNTGKWKWIAVMVSILVLASALVATIAILSGDGDSDDDTSDQGVGAMGAESGLGVPHGPGSSPADGENGAESDEEGASSDGDIASAPPDAISDGGPLPGDGRPPDPSSDPANIPQPEDVWPSVEPVGENDYMVLVCELAALQGTEQLAGSGRSNVTNTITDDLRLNLTSQRVPFSNIQVRRYPMIVSSATEARFVADHTGAAVIVWGNYDDERVQLNIQVGSLAPFPYNPFPREELENLVNIRVEMTDEREESAAAYVLGTLGILVDADGDGFETMRAMALIGTLDVQNASISPAYEQTIAAPVHRYLQVMVDDSEQGILYLTDAIEERGAASPILYAERGATYLRLGEVDRADNDLRLAESMTGPGVSWSQPLLVRTVTTTNLDEALDLFTQVIEMRPDDWFPLFFRGAIYYEIREFDLARADMEQAIALEPDANFPYIYATLIALHEGRITDAGIEIGTILALFPDPNYMQRLVEATFGTQFPDAFSLTMSAFTNLVLKNYEAVVEDASQGIELTSEYSVDAYMMRGFAYCALDDYVAAEADYTRALELDPGFMLAYVLRGEVRRAQGDYSAANDDFNVVRDDPNSEELYPLVRAVRAGQLDCTTFFTSANPLLQPRIEIESESGEAVTITPVAHGEYMVLVAQPQRLGNAADRDVQGPVVRNLQRTFEENLPYSNIRIRTYDEMITTPDQAREVAEAAGAVVIIWGTYTDAGAELEIQVGSTAQFPYILFEREAVERTTNVTARLDTDLQQCIAGPVINIINILSVAEGDESQFMLTLATLVGITHLDLEAAPLVGNSLAIHLHRALVASQTDRDTTLSEIDLAIELAEGNAIPYFYRSVLSLITMEEGFETLPAQVQQDLNTAQTLAPADWTALHYLAVTEDPAADIPIYSEIMALQPDDWYPVYLRGLMYYELGQFEEAQQDLDQSMALQPTTSQPYLIALMLALRSGDIVEAQQLAVIVTSEFPSAMSITRINRALDSSEAYLSSANTFSTTTNLLLGQYSTVARATDDMLWWVLTDPPPDLATAQGEPGAPGVVDVLMVRGIAYCNLGEIDPAQTAYSFAIDIDPENVLLYALRG
ncbi:MAG: tetratricopeptide repeat protein, partial [Chloroflexi bacterium]|nr:tetratricopeptide repeat protein [Chloroflexota bacterium]